ncbi:acyl-CoA dehydrogenase family protein [Isosphaeraceae bacterium EP7]
MTHPDADDLAAPYADSPSERTRLAALIGRLAGADAATDETDAWPSELWQILLDERATLWSLPAELGGEGCDRPTLVGRNAAVAQGSLTAAFILSQHDAAVRRLAVVADENPVAREWLARIARGESFGTVGISQLTTSRRHGTQAMRVTEADGGYVLDGIMPWVTAAERADIFITGGVLEDGRQLLTALPRDRPGVIVKPAFPLAALGASRTAEVRCENARVELGEVLIGPSNDVMAIPGLAGTGGLETTALALGLARAALLAFRAEAEHREDLTEPAEALSAEWIARWDDLMSLANSEPGAPAPQAIRGLGNDLVLRLTQSYLTAAKGSGFVRGEPAQRWARQALFFLVWSCPSPVARASMRDMAGLCPV